MTTKRKKDPYAVALGKRGSKARMVKLTPEQRREIARNAVLVRWERARKVKKAAATAPRKADQNMKE